MINSILYPLILILMFIFIYNGMMNSISYIPLKIKNIAIIAYSAFLLKWTALIILMVKSSIFSLYFLKPIYLLDTAAFPLTVILTIFIILRNNKLKFSNILMILPAIGILYAVIFIFTKENIILSGTYGYTIVVDGFQYILLLYFLINIVSLVLAIKKLNQSFIDSKGVKFIIFASSIALIEIVFRLTGIYLVQECLIGEVLWIAVLNYSLHKLKGREI